MQIEKIIEFEKKLARKQISCEESKKAIEQIIDKVMQNDSSQINNLFLSIGIFDGKKYFDALNCFLKYVNFEMLDNKSIEISHKFIDYICDNEDIDDLDKLNQVKQMVLKLFEELLGIEKCIYSIDYYVDDVISFAPELNIESFCNLYEFFDKNFRSLVFDNYGYNLIQVLDVIKTVPNGTKIIENHFECLIDNYIDTQRDDIVDFLNILNDLYLDNSYKSYIKLIENNLEILEESKYDGIKMVLYSLIAGKSKKIDEHINNQYKENKKEIIKNSLSHLGFYKIDDGILENYLDTVILLIDELKDKQNLDFSNLKFLNYGFYSTIFELGDYVLKLGKDRFKYEIIDNSHMLKPIFRYSFSSKTCEESLIVEILPKVKNLEKGQRGENVIYQMYKSLVKQNIIWSDISVSNVGLIKYDSYGNLEKFNQDSLNKFGINDINKRFYGIKENPYKNNDEILIKMQDQIYQAVIIDNDFMFTMGEFMEKPVYSKFMGLYIKELEDKKYNGEELDKLENRFLTLYDKNLER